MSAPTCLFSEHSSRITRLVAKGHPTNSLTALMARMLQNIGQGLKGVFVQFTIGQMLSASAARFAGKPAVVTPDRTLAIDELDRLSTTFARQLRARGLAPGDRVTIWMENGWRWMVSYYGALRLGAVVNPCNILLTADEVAFIVQDCGAKAVIVARERSAELRGRAAALLITDGGRRSSSIAALSWRPTKFRAPWCSAKTSRRPAREKFCAAHWQIRTLRQTTKRGWI